MTMTRKIEVDEATATELEIRAAERGFTMSELIAELLQETEPVEVSTEELAELDRRSAAILAGEKTVPNEEVVRWLETWGTPEFRPWNKR